MRDWVANGGRHPLLPGLGDGPAPLPVDGARAPARRRRRGPGAVPRRCSAAPTPTGWWPAWAGGRTRRGPSPASSTPTPRLVGVEAAGGAAIGRGVPGVVHGMKSFLLQDEAGQVARGPLHLGRARLPGHRARARPPVGDRAGALRARRRRRGPRRLPAAGADRGHHPRPGARPRPGLAGARGAAVGARRRHRARHPVGSRRQGRRPGARPARDDRRALGSLEAPPAGPAGRGPQAARPLRHRRHGPGLDRGGPTPWPTPAPTPSRSASPSPTR